jgi:hypothetical protein
MARLLLLLVVGLTACHGARHRQIVGEVHIHGFANGFHSAATFVARGTPEAQVRGVSILPEGAYVRRDGPCALATSTYGTPPVMPTPLDAGPLQILGGKGVPRLELAFDSGQHTYLSPSLPQLNSALFVGGESLTVAGGGHGGIPSFRGVLDAPRPLILTAPTQLQVGPDPFVVSWQPDRANLVELALIASTSDGRWSLVKCQAEDSAGQLVFPASLLAALPSPPRDLQLAVSRDTVVHAITSHEEAGVLLHASFAVQLKGHE